MDGGNASCLAFGAKVEAALASGQLAALEELVRATPKRTLAEYWESGEVLRLTLQHGNVALLKMMQPSEVESVPVDSDEDDEPSLAPQSLTTGPDALYDPISHQGQEVIGEADLGLEALKIAITRFSRTRPAPWDFYVDLLPHIKAWALEEHSVRLPIMLPYDSNKATFTTTPRVARHILANAFFLNTRLLSAQARKLGGLGELTFYGVYSDPHDLAPERVERVICQIAYFFLSTNDAELDARPSIVFERRWPSASVAEREAFWQTSPQHLPPVEHVNVHSNAMEDVPGKHFVDFANKFIHIGRIIPSLTQEEVLFSCCPEAFLCLLFIGELRDREVLVVRNIRRCSTYTGYLSTFRWTGLWPAFRLHDILVIDACIGGQFKLRTVVRDLEKAYQSFAICTDDRISTGHWGCGVFGGDKTLKFLQQLCSAAVAGARLDYSTYRDNELAASLRDLHAQLVAKGVTVGRVVRTVSGFRGATATFATWVKQELCRDEEASMQAKP